MSEGLFAVVKIGSTRDIALSCSEPVQRIAVQDLTVHRLKPKLCGLKLHELKFPVSAVISAAGAAPLPPVAQNDLEAVGRTNDAILYGASVNLWVRCEDELIEGVGPRVPSSASAAHGRLFLNLFAAVNQDFYALDPMLFSPAVVNFHNLNTGRTLTYGHQVPELLRESFGLSAKNS